MLNKLSHNIKLCYITLGSVSIDFGLFGFVYKNYIMNKDKKSTLIFKKWVKNMKR